MVWVIEGQGPCAVRLGSLSSGVIREKGAQRTRIKRRWFCRWCGESREVGWGRGFVAEWRSGMAERGCGLGDELADRGALANNSMKPTTLSRIFLSFVSLLVRFGLRIVSLRQPCGGLSRSRWADGDAGESKVRPSNECNDMQEVKHVVDK